MGLITQTAAEYYTGSILQQGNGGAAYAIYWPNDMPSLLFSNGQSQTADDNFEIFVDNVLQVDSDFASLPVLNTSVSNGVQTQYVEFTLNNNVSNNQVIKLALKTQATYDNQNTYQSIADRNTFITQKFLSTLQTTSYF